MSTLILLVVIGLIGICVWLFRLADAEHADRQARDRRLRAELRAAAEREHARQQLDGLGER